MAGGETEQRSGGTGLQKSRTPDVPVHDAKGRNAPRAGHAPATVHKGTNYMVVSQTIEVETEDAPDFIDLTDLVADVVAVSGVSAGQVLVFSQHTTAAIKINENEPLLLRDITHFLDRAAPKDAYYGHNDFAIRTVNMHEDECPNGHSHCQHLLLGSSETIPVVDAKLAMGRFQRLFLVELDMPKSRTVIVQVMGV